ncbi:MAG: D-alanine--poly(phosphoribitol) ligase subunit DltA [Bacteroidia bacterium]
MRLQELITKNTQCYPDQTAIINPDDSKVSYSELTGEYQVLTEKLRQHLKKQHRVLLILPKEASSVALMLAILQLECAYIPADVTIPEARLQNIIAESDPELIVFLSGDARAEKLFPSPYHENIQIGKYILIKRNSNAHKEDLAYILFTSGSTGTPKGVMITHENAVSFCRWASETFPFQPGEIILSVAPLYFDLSVYDLFCGLSNGATILFRDEQFLHNPRQVNACIAEMEITRIYATPSFLTTLLLYGKPEKSAYPALRYVLFAGEVFAPKHLHALMEHFIHATFVNLYGPTETNVCSYFTIPRPIDNHQKEPYPVGRILNHLEEHITEEGELLISGNQVAAGYFNRPNETAQKFIQQDGRIWYKTGDLIKRLQNGQLAYSGRTDRMIKKRGYRIEPEEIEHTLLSIPEVAKAVIIADEGPDGFAILKAFIVAGENVNPAALREYCASKLPSWMIPDQFIQLPEIPLTASGKTDYLALKSISN